MAVKVMVDGQPIGNVELGVFADVECRTAARTNEAGIAYLTIPGDEECQLTVKIAIGNDVVDAPLTLTYKTDAVFGTPGEPMLIDLGQTTGISEIENSEFVNSKCFDLSGRQIVNGKLRKGVYIINGKKEVK